MEGKEKLLSDHQLKTPAWNAAWWVTCHATERGTKTYDAIIHPEKKYLPHNCFIS